MFLQEKEASKSFTDSTKFRMIKRNNRDIKTYTTEFAQAYSKRLGTTINQQLIQSANLFSDFLYTSWVDAGKPDINNLVRETFTRGDKKNLKREIRAYRRNQLLEKQMLRAFKFKDDGF
jgi:hypothetical protein